MARICGLLPRSYVAVPGEPPGLRAAALRMRRHCERDLVFEQVGPLHLALLTERGDGPQGPPACRATDPARELDLFLDGLLFNRSELREQLRSHFDDLGRDPRDPELALAAFIEWGEACFARLSGIFAIALLDRARGRLLLVRDAFGAKPMHYARIGEFWAFASQVSPLVDLVPGTRVDQRALFEYAMYGDLLPPATLFEKVAAVPPGHCLILEHGQEDPRLHRYHDALAVVEQREHDRLRAIGAQKFLEELDGHLHRSIRENLADGGPFGIALSGGVDSATLTAIAARYAPVHAINVSATQRKRLDERPMAEAVARHVGVPISIVAMTGERHRAELVDATLSNELPLWHVQSVAYNVASRRARELGLSALLCGDTIGMMLSPGSLLPWRFLQPFLTLSERLPDGIGPFVQKLGHAFAGLPLNSQAFSWALPLAAQLVDGYERAVLQQECEAKYAFVRKAVRCRVHGGRLAEVYAQFPRFFHRGDRLGQAWGVEYRTPLADQESLRFAMNLPYEYLYRRGNSKWSIKELGARYLPRSIAFQKKVGWNMPVDLYFAPFANLRFFDGGYCQEAFRLTPKCVESALRQWTREPLALVRLVHIEIWGRLFAWRQPPEQVKEWLRSFEPA